MADRPSPGRGAGRADGAESPRLLEGVPLPGAGLGADRFDRTDRQGEKKA
jgi:hypothetical protein